MDRWGNGEETGEIREDGAVWYDYVGEWVNAEAAEAFLEQLRNTDNGLSTEEEARISKIFQSAIEFFGLDQETWGNYGSSPPVYREEHSVILRAAGWDVQKAYPLMTQYKKALYPHPNSYDRYKAWELSQEQQNHLSPG